MTNSWSTSSCVGDNFGGGFRKLNKDIQPKACSVDILYVDEVGVVWFALPTVNKDGVSTQEVDSLKSSKSPRSNEISFKKSGYYYCQRLPEFRLRVELTMRDYFSEDSWGLDDFFYSDPEVNPFEGNGGLAGKKISSSEDDTCSDESVELEADEYSRSSTESSESEQPDRGSWVVTIDCSLCSYCKQSDHTKGSCPGAPLYSKESDGSDTVEFDGHKPMEREVNDGLADDASEKLESDEDIMSTMESSANGEPDGRGNDEDDGYDGIESAEYYSMEREVEVGGAHTVTDVHVEAEMAALVDHECLNADQFNEDADIEISDGETSKNQSLNVGKENRNLVIEISDSEENM